MYNAVDNSAGMQVMQNGEFVDFSDPGLLGSMNPALRSSNVHPTLKLLYERPAVAQDLFRTVDEPLNEYRDILEQTMISNIKKVTGGGSFGIIKGQFKSESGIIEGYGGAFTISFEEKRWNRVNLLFYHQNKLVTEMKKYYELQVLSTIRDNTPGSTFIGSKWTDTSVGDPFKDFEHARGLVYAKTGTQPDIVILNQTMYEYIIAYDEFRDLSKLGVALLQKGDIKEILRPNGLKLVVFPDSLNSYIEDNLCYVAKQGLMGTNHRALPFTTITADPPYSRLGGPWDTDVYGMEWMTPSIDEVDTKYICKITGLNTGP